METPWRRSNDLVVVATEKPECVYTNIFVRIGYKNRVRLVVIVRHTEHDELSEYKSKRLKLLLMVISRSACVSRGGGG